MIPTGLDMARRGASEVVLRVFMVFSPFRIGGMTEEEVSELLNISPWAVRSDRSLARVRPYRELRGYLILWPGRVTTCGLASLCAR